MSRRPSKAADETYSAADTSFIVCAIASMMFSLGAVVGCLVQLIVLRGLEVTVSDLVPALSFASAAAALTAIVMRWLRNIHPTTPEA